MITITYRRAIIFDYLRDNSSAVSKSGMFGTSLMPDARRRQIGRPSAIRDRIGAPLAVQTTYRGVEIKRSLFHIVDFAPHRLEQLRRDHEHRRLGFTDAEIAEWMIEAGLEPQRINHLDSEKLTVTLWLGIKPENAPVIHLSAVA